MTIPIASPFIDDFATSFHLKSHNWPISSVSDVFLHFPDNFPCFPYNFPPNPPLSHGSSPHLNSASAWRQAMALAQAETAAEWATASAPAGMTKVKGYIY